MFLEILIELEGHLTDDDVKQRRSCKPDDLTETFASIVANLFGLFLEHSAELTDDFVELDQEHWQRKSKQQLS